ncbi:MAG: putative molybdenum carrier protein [Bacteroidales bacterium]|nr:putative molybdenum carrier protein [Bacteroidales bacterium]
MLDISIISGGQTGVDRAALDFALKRNFVCGGWCPKGRLAEDGLIPAIYPLKETQTANYSERTEKNILESDGTLILNLDKIDPGTVLTQNLCIKRKKPYWIQKLTNFTNIENFYLWLINNKIKTLNIAGPRESSSSGIYLKTLDFLEKVF